ncbi:MAG: hypothetical protein FWB77_02045 [Treponema sp.]|nr:hypothetical protein [Treponema sp.]
MKNPFSPANKISGTLYIVLLIVLGCLILLIILGTIFGLVRSETSPVLKLGGSVRAEHAGTRDDIRVFAGLGRLRIPLVNSSTLLLTIAFPYNANDAAFTEELAVKISDFRAIAAGYFSSLPEDNIIQINEETAKLEILKRYNANLRLGSIETLYFSDMMVIDANF